MVLGCLSMNFKYLNREMAFQLLHCDALIPEWKVRLSRSVLLSVLNVHILNIHCELGKDLTVYARGKCVELARISNDPQNWQMRKERLIEGWASVISNINKISRKQIRLLLILYMDEWQNVPTLHIVIYFAGTAVFMSFNINQQKHNTYYELSNIIHAKLKPISSKCCLGQTNSHQQAAQLTKMALRSGIEVV